MAAMTLSERCRQDQRIESWHSHSKAHGTAGTGVRACAGNQALGKALHLKGAPHLPVGHLGMSSDGSVWIRVPSHESCR